MDEQVTTIQVDVKTRDALRVIAKQDGRSMTKELRWLVTQEYFRRKNAIEIAAVHTVTPQMISDSAEAVK